MAKHRNRLPKEVVESLSLEVFKKCADVMLRGTVWGLLVGLSELGGLFQPKGFCELQDQFLIYTKKIILSRKMLCSHWKPSLGKPLCKEERSRLPGSLALQPELLCSSAELQHWQIRCSWTVRPLETDVGTKHSEGSNRDILYRSLEITNASPWKQDQGGFSNRFPNGTSAMDFTEWSGLGWRGP